MGELDGVVVEGEEAVEGLDEELQDNVADEKECQAEIVGRVGALEETLDGRWEGMSSRRRSHCRPLVLPCPLRGND